MRFIINSHHFDALRKVWEKNKKLPLEIIESIQQIFSYWSQLERTPFGIRLETISGERIVGLCYGIGLDMKDRVWLSKVIIWIERACHYRKKGRKRRVKQRLVIQQKCLLLELKKIEFSPPLLTTDPPFPW